MLNNSKWDQLLTTISIVNGTSDENTPQEARDQETNIIDSTVVVHTREEDLNVCDIETDDMDESSDYSSKVDSQSHQETGQSSRYNLRRNLDHRSYDLDYNSQDDSNEEAINCVSNYITRKRKSLSEDDADYPETIVDDDNKEKKCASTLSGELPGNANGFEPFLPNKMDPKSDGAKLYSELFHPFKIDDDAPCSITLGRWCAAEDERLANAVSLFGEKSWKLISEFVRSKTNLQCRQRWLKCIRPGIKKGKWSEEEDKMLLSIMKATKFFGWRLVSEKIPGRTSKQCRDRWNNYLSPNVAKAAIPSKEYTHQSYIRNESHLANHLTMNHHLKNCDLREEMKRYCWPKTSNIGSSNIPTKKLSNIPSLHVENMIGSNSSSLSNSMKLSSMDHSMRHSGHISSGYEKLASSSRSSMFPPSFSSSDYRNIPVHMNSFNMYGDHVDFQYSSSYDYDSMVAFSHFGDRRLIESLDCIISPTLQNPKNIQGRK